MDAVDKKFNELSAQKIALQEKFKKYNEKNGFNYEEWVNPPAGHFYETYKKNLSAIDMQMAPPLNYQK